MAGIGPAGPRLCACGGGPPNAGPVPVDGLELSTGAVWMATRILCVGPAEAAVGLPGAFGDGLDVLFGLLAEEALFPLVVEAFFLGEALVDLFDGFWLLHDDEEEVGAGLFLAGWLVALLGAGRGVVLWAEPDGLGSGLVVVVIASLLTRSVATLVALEGWI